MINHSFTNQAITLSTILLLTVFVQSSTGQNCGSQIPQEHVEFVLHEMAQQSVRRDRPDPPDPPDPPELDTNRKLIPVKAHIIRNSFEFTTLSVAEIEAAIENVNQIYAPINMVFFLCGEVNYIDNDDWYSGIEAGGTDETTITNNHNVANKLNLYFTSSLWNADGGLAGYAYMMLPPFFTQNDWIFIANQFVSNGTTIPHEIGHYFNLFHTHEPGFGLENVTRDENDACYNCYMSGDLLCDTNADPELNCGGSSPNVSETTPGNCTYLGPPTLGGCGETYVPPTDNIMSYGCKPCRNMLSFLQLHKVQETYFNVRNYLDVGDCPTIPCENDFLILTDPVTVDEVFEVNDYILAYNTVNSGVDAEYDAGNFIQLKPGFITQPGCHFKAYIEGCTPGQKIEHARDGDLFEAVSQQPEMPSSKAFPNPFSQECMLLYNVPGDQLFVRIDVFDVSGTKIKTVMNKGHNAGQYRVKIEGDNLAPGFYYYVYGCGPHAETGKLVLSR